MPNFARNGSVAIGVELPRRRDHPGRDPAPSEDPRYDHRLRGALEARGVNRAEYLSLQFPRGRMAESQAILNPFERGWKFIRRCLPTYRYFPRPERAVKTAERSLQRGRAAAIAFRPCRIYR